MTSRYVLPVSDFYFSELMIKRHDHYIDAKNTALKIVMYIFENKCFTQRCLCRERNSKKGDIFSVKKMLKS